VLTEALPTIVSLIASCEAVVSLWKEPGNADLRALIGRHSPPMPADESDRETSSIQPRLRVVRDDD
jgi:hypothetical protein